MSRSRFSKINPLSNKLWRVREAAATDDNPAAVRQDIQDRALEATTGYDGLEQGDIAKKALIEKDQTEGL